MNEPRKYVNRFTFVLISAIACLAVVQSARAAEPVYNGKALSEWLVAQDREAQQDAIRGMALVNERKGINSCD